MQPTYLSLSEYTWLSAKVRPRVQGQAENTQADVVEESMEPLQPMLERAFIESETEGGTSDLANKNFMQKP